MPRTHTRFDAPVASEDTSPSPKRKGGKKQKKQKKKQKEKKKKRGKTKPRSADHIKKNTDTGNDIDPESKEFEGTDSTVLIYLFVLPALLFALHYLSMGYLLWMVLQLPFLSGIVSGLKDIALYMVQLTAITILSHT